MKRQKRRKQSLQEPGQSMDKEQSNPQKSTGSNKREVHGSISVAGQIEVSSPKNKRRDDREDEQNTRDKHRFAVEMVTLGFVAFVAILNIITIHQSNSHFSDDQRPYIGLTNELGPWDITPETDRFDAGKLHFNFHFKNYGKTPAINMLSESQIDIGYDNEKSISYNPMDPKTGSILPPGEQGFNTAFTKDRVDREFLMRMVNPADDVQVFVHGLIQYSDRAGHVYKTEFCEERNESGGYQSCRTHNYIQ